MKCVKVCEKSLYFCVQMSSKLPVPPSQTFHYLLDNSPVFKCIAERNRERLMKYLANNEYLLKKKGQTVYSQLRRISIATGGFFIQHSSYSKWRLGKRGWCCDIIYTLLADYHGLTVSELENLKRDDI